MSEAVKMPALGESVSEGTVTQWLKAVGDTVEVDEPLLEVSTDKVDTEVPSPVAGTIEKILVEEDETVEVGTDLVMIGDGSGGGSDDAPADEAPAETDEAPAEAEEPAEPESEEPAEEPAEEAPAEQEAEEASESAPASASTGGGGGQEVTMPALGESVSEGTVTQWLKAVGDEVAVDEPLLEVSTDKVDTEVPSPFSGTLTDIKVGEDETVEVGAVLAIIGGDADSSAAAPAEEAAPAPSKPAEDKPAEQPEDEPEPPKEKAAPPAPPEDKPEPPKEKAAPPAPPEDKPEPPTEKPAPPADAAGATSYVTPLVRKLARDLGVDLDTVSGSGVGGRIRKQDVEAAAEAAKAPAAASAAPAGAPAAKAPTTVPPASTLRGTTEKMSRTRKVIAKRMMESMQTTAQLTTVVEVDLTRIADLRTRAKSTFQANEGVKLTYLPFLVKSATEALKAHPKLNAQIDGENVIYHDVENVGIAVDTEKGLMVTVVKDAGDLTLGGIAKRIAEQADRARTGKVTPDDVSGATFTVTNTGSGGALFDTPIVNQPGVAILGTGTITRRPVVVKDTDGNEAIAIRSMMYLAISYDHQLVDGADAARFLQTMKARLEEGSFEGDLGL
ncbi:2-oxoglutarate dehydrogenase, E2 component, dihydrolipoamide succinyltransferase [Georgenia sp. Z1491]|uniref:2-oxoglutarate dehydrogenase, E2 component, dihydrolipoamide succinyltransferase n=1 Tax=Georgenia sp. Z1491 TaxID=3416707 RepID=UPI003CF60132